jgi:death-on-curing protein
MPRKAAALMESLARNHALIDGNKRVAWGATKLFLLYNDLHLTAPDPEQGEKFVLAVASGEIDLAEIAVLITRWCTPLA